jgi:predicted dehydrogenase
MYQGTYRAAVIGHTGQGNYGHGLDLAFMGLPGVEVVAVADPDDAGRARAQHRIGAARAYADYREMLERERPDVVSVATRWPDQHEAMIRAAVAAGARGVYCEKPLAPSPESADAIVAACERRNVKLNVAHHNRVRPAPRYVKRLVDEGKIGRLRLMRAFGKSDRRGGGEDLMVLGTHLLDLMGYFAGDARWCHARVVTGGHDATPADIGASRTEQLGPIVGDDVVASFGFDRGITGTFESTRATDGGGSDYFHLELCGTAGIIAFWSDPGSPVYFHPRPFVIPAPAVEWERLEPPSMDPASGAPPDAGSFFDSNQALVRDLLGAIEMDRPTVSTGQMARAALEMIMAVYASHVAGTRVSLPLVERGHPLVHWQRAEDQARQVLPVGPTGGEAR